MSPEVTVALLIVLGLVGYMLYETLKSPFNLEAYEKEQRRLIKDAMRKPKKRKKYKSRSKALTVEAPHKRKPGRPKKETKK